MLKEKISLRVDAVIKTKLEDLAEKEGRPTSDFCRFILERFAAVQTSAQIAVIQILKEGEDQKKAEKYLDAVIKTKPIEIDGIIADKITELVGGRK